MLTKGVHNSSKWQSTEYGGVQNGKLLGSTCQLNNDVGKNHTEE